MRLAVNFCELFNRKVSVDFGRREVAVPQKSLQVSEIHTVFQKMGGKTVPQHVGCDSAVNSAVFRQSIDDVLHAALGQRFPFEIAENNGFLLFSCRAFKEIILNGINGLARYRKQPFLLAVSEDIHGFSFEIHVLYFE